MKNVLVSGSNGFVGQNITKFLTSKGFKVHPLKRQGVLYAGESEEGFNWGNIDNEKLDSIDAIIHLAGKAHDLKKTANDAEYFEINTQLTSKLFDAFLKSKASVFIFMSSVKAGADSVDNILTENIVPEPKTPYGRSKLKAEEYLLSHTLPEGKRVFILRPCMIHGPGNKGNLNLLYKFVERGIPYPLAAYENKRSFLSVGNLNFIVGKLVKEPFIPTGIYNLADDEPLSVNRVIKIIADVKKIKPRLWKISPAIIKLLARAGDALHLPLNTDRFKKLTESYVVSNAKIKKALNLANLPLSSENGLKLTIESFHTQ